jgi:radical SAM superfamily enzyme YgiQ (UPF0313 family)
MNVSLVFPPQHYPFHPYLSLPTLAGYIRSQGYRVAQKDLNRQLYEALLTPSNLKQSYAELTALQERLEKKSRLTAQELGKYRQWGIALLVAPYLIKNIESAKAVLCHPDDFFDPEKFTWSYNVLYRSMDLVTARYYPTKFDLKNFETPYSTQSSRDLIKSTRDGKLNPFIDFFKKFSIVEEIFKDKPDFVGISVASNYTQLIAALTLARMIKERDHTVYINLGGSGLSLIANDLERCKRLFSMADSFTVYDGETSLLTLLRELEAKKNFSNVPNLIWCKRGTVIANKPYITEPMESVPTPDYRGLPIKKYRSPLPVLSVQISRGCYWNRCSYCQRERGLSHATHPYRTRACEQIIRDIKTLSSRYAADHFYFISEAVRPEFLVNLSTLLLESKLKIRWYTWARFEEGFTKETCKLLAAAGCRKLMFGLESAHPRTLQRNQKGIDLDNVRRTLKNLKAAGISAHLWLMVGFPGETIEEAVASKDFVLENLQALDSPGFSFDFSAFMLAKNSEIERFPEKYGIRKLPASSDDLVVSMEYETTQGISPVESKTIAADFREEIFNNLSLPFPLVREDHIFSFLYADRYPASDKNTARHLSRKTPRVAKTVLLHSIPRISKRCYHKAFKFNITKSGLDEQKDGSVKPRETNFIFVGTSMDITYISRDGKSLLDLVDGKKTVEAIITTFHDRNGLARNAYKSQCLALFHKFIRDGIVEFKG